MAEDKPHALKKTLRKSPTLNANHRKGPSSCSTARARTSGTAAALDDYTSLLIRTARYIRSKQKFNNYSAHVEFFLPFRPDARDQRRGNSGFTRWTCTKCSILDSFGLEGLA